MDAEHETRRATWEGWNAYIAERWRHLSDEVTSSEQRVLNYLILVNAGGAATVLTYIAALQPDHVAFAAQGALLCFIVGILLVGFLIAKSHYFLANLRDEWVRGVEEFRSYRGNSWDAAKDAFDKLITDDSKRSVPPKVIEVLAWIAFGLFILGAILGTCVIAGA